MGLEHRLESLYPKLPLLGQNLLISGKGYLFKRERYGGDFNETLTRIDSEATQNADRLQALQIKRCAAFLDHARATSPYYRSVAPKATFTDLDDLRQWPVLEKDTLRQRTKAIASEAYQGQSLIKSFTSGSTGTPIEVSYTRDDFRLRFAYLNRMFKRFGMPPLVKSVRLSGRTLFPDAAKSGVFWRMNWPMQQMLMSSFDLHPDNLQAYVDKLSQYAPRLIDGYPSSIFVLARFINQSGQSGRVCPDLIMTTAETLEPYQREEITAAFGGCPVVNQYASSEGAPFITQDEFGDLVVNTDTGVFEFVKPGTDQPAGPGEIAEMLLTSFTTHAYPLIRYRIGDTVRLPETPRLAKSWAMPVVEEILGRQEDILYTPERGYVGRLDPVFKKCPSTIIESQIVQTAPMAITLKVVPDKSGGFELSQLDRVKAEIIARLGNIDITVEMHDTALPRGPSGKLRAVIGL